MQERRWTAAGMGCPECAAASIEGGELQPVCIRADSEEECRDVNPGGSGTFHSGSIPAELTTAADSSAYVLLPIRGMSVLTVVAAVLNAFELAAQIIE